MAAEIVVGALVSASLNVLLEKIASPYVVEFFKGKKRSGFSSRLYDMKMKFLALSAVLADAEQKQNKVPGVKEWLDELKDVVDDAEDLFAGIEYDALKLKITEKEKSTAITAKVSNKLSKLVNFTGSKRKNQMDEILRRLEQFEKQISILRLVGDVKKEELTERSPTTSLPDEPEVYGRDKDKDGLLKMLMSEDSGSSSSQKIYEVIPIVGMGGVGKTTLAQTLFNDEQVKNKFEVLAWVYVSDKFDAMAVTKTILQCIAPGESFNNMSLDSLQVNLSKKLMGKKFFIVLDDAWEEEYVCWKNVMKPLDDGGRGSKLIVTTRSANVADGIRTGDTHQLRALSEDDCWELFANHASNGNPRKFDDNPKLESIGRKLVGKCKGLPLAAKVLGGILRSTWDVDRWEQIARSNVWEMSKTLPAVLEVSYHYLPPHLKGCFAYCSIFPKGYKFDKKELVLIWMAENLVKHSEGSRSMEEVGNAYFDDLVSLSFFQIKTREFAENIVSMHDLIVDLARAVSGKYNYLLEHSEDIGKFEKKTRHLGCTKELLCCNEKISSYDFEPTRLRTFLALRSEYQDMCIPKEVVHHLVSKLKRLRVVSFRYSGMTELSNSIGELIYLCYLDLSFTNIVKLPDSVTILYNLQTLKLEGCSKLETLPKDMHHLINLRYLNVLGTGLVEMPSQISKLQNLQILSTFIVGKESGAKIEELAELLGLRGKLCIEQLENVGSIVASDQVNVLDRKQLEELSLKWYGDGDGDDPKCGEGVLDMLSANTTLKQLCIFGYPGMKFSTWIGDDSFSNIVDIKLMYCKRCTSLPPLGQLSFLKHLHIVKFDSVVSVGSEFYGWNSSYGRKPFSALETLRFIDMSSWEQWHSMQAEDDATTYGKLETLEISNCPKLIGDLPCFFPSLTKIQVDAHKQCTLKIPRIPCARSIYIRYLEDRESLEKAIKPTDPYRQLHQQQQHMMTMTSGSAESCSLTSTACLPTTTVPLQSLELSYCGEFFRSLDMDLFPNLKTLEIRWCNYFESLSMSVVGPCLQELTSLTICDCPSFVSFPNNALTAPKLTFLKLKKCPKVKWLPEEKRSSSLPSLNFLTIDGCPLIETIPESRLSELRISYHQFLGMKWNWQTLPHLRFLSVYENEEDIESFPAEGLLPPTITSLYIYQFSKLRGLDRNGLTQLTSLETLEIYTCPELQTLSEEGFPTSLRYLHFLECPLLKKTYGPKESDKSWYKISHIPNVEFYCE